MMIQVTGIGEVQANLSNVVKIVSKTKTEGLIEVGERGVGYIDKQTPVVSGRLRNSMSYTIDKKVYSPLGSPTGDDKLNKQSAKDEVDIGTNVIYAPSVEYLATNGSEGFMQRAYTKTKQVAEKILASTIKGGVN